MWEYKRAKLQSATFNAELDSQQYPMTVQRGYYYGAQEMLKYLYLPYTDNQLQEILFANGEKARVWDAYMNARKGLFSDVFQPISKNGEHPAYYFKSGIQSLASQNIDNPSDVIAPHSVYTLFLAD